MALIQLPGLIDPHVHLREPGDTHKEDWGSGTSAALAGGYTSVLAMPNTSPPVTDHETLATSLSAASNKARCDYGVYLGASVHNTTTASHMASQVAGLKIYLDQTFGPLRLDSLQGLQTHIAAWPRNRPLLCHAEGHNMAAALMVALLQDRHIHICHVSRKAEISLIRAARERGCLVTCEVTPHHLFLTEKDAAYLGLGRCHVRPSLNTQSDHAVLWQALNEGVIDCIATDHAPHTLAEKDGENPPPGFPGLETALSLMLGAVRDGKVTHERMIALMHTNPLRIFGIQPPMETTVDVDLDEKWEVTGKKLHTGCGWSPFEGWQMQGRVKKVTIRAQSAYENGKILAAPGLGKHIIYTQ